MFSFKGFFTKDKNTHLEHLEDDIINRGSKGGVNAINFLKSVRDMLAGTLVQKSIQLLNGMEHLLLYVVSILKTVNSLLVLNQYSTSTQK